MAGVRLHLLLLPADRIQTLDIASDAVLIGRQITCLRVRLLDFALVFGNFRFLVGNALEAMEASGGRILLRARVMGMTAVVTGRATATTAN